MQQSLAIDGGGLSQLKRLAHDQSPDALKAASKQFEALFLQMVMKAMRDATPQDGMFDSDSSRTYRDMLDQQLTQSLADRGATGLAAMIEKQLSRSAAVSDPDAPLKQLNSSIPFTGVGALPGASASDANLPINSGNAASNSSRVGRVGSTGEISARPLADAIQSAAGATQGVPADVKAFVQKVYPHAVQAAQATGIPVQFLIAQAALETGWGKGEIRRADGSPSFNLFNIKAGRSWQGGTVDTMTTEFANGQASKSVERFRAYNSYGEAFADYARLMRSQPRYSDVLNQTDPAGFARALQSSGYATDPAYADKLQRIIGSSVLRAGLTG